MRRRFFWSIFGVAALTAVLLSGVAIGSINSVRTNATRAELVRAAGVVAELVSARLDDRRVVAALLQDQAIDTLDLAALRRAAGGSELTFFAIGPNGNVVGRPAISELGLDLGALQAGQTISFDFPSGATTVQAVAAPVETRASDATVVVLLTRAAPLDVELPRGFLFMVLVLVAVVALVLAQVLSRGLTRRLRSVAVASTALSAGDHTARAEVGGSDEVHTVAESFNQMADQLEASRERERQFLLAVGHDLRTPLTTITGYAEALEDGLDDPAEVQRVAGVMSVEVARLRRLIEDVMLLARLESAEFGLRPEPVDVGAHVAGLVQPYADRASALRIRCTIDVQDTGVRLVDPDRIGQIVGNLCENALRFTPEMGRIGVTVRSDGSVVELAVSNSGPGIDSDDLPHLFERFYVARRYRGIRPEGSGLGLSIVDAITRAMGGSVMAASPPDETVFTVRFPAPKA
jgi:two-component system sensor histidine kinase BaeS